MKKRVYIMSWPSWVGKTTVWEIIINSDNLNFEKIITTTTRQPRDDEFYWVHYYFVEEEKFDRLVESWSLIEYAKVHWNYYWSTYEELERILHEWLIPLYIVDHQWALFLKEKLKDDYDVVTVVLLPPNKDELLKRLNKRWTETEETLKIRFQESMEQLEEKDFYDYEIVNDNLEKTVEEFIKITKNS